jgi:DNA-binding MarR family transcriptional regulator
MFAMSETLGKVNDDRIIEFGAALEALSRLARAVDTSLRTHAGISQPEFEALLHIERSGGEMTMGNLAERILFTSGGATRLVDRLGDRSLAERRNCAEDRRIQYVAITDRGRQVLEQALEVHVDNVEREYFSRLSKGERETLACVLGRLRTSAKEATRE